jgi:hypothetical protein
VHAHAQIAIGVYRAAAGARCGMLHSMLKAIYSYVDQLKQRSSIGVTTISPKTPTKADVVKSKTPDTVKLRTPKRRRNKQVSVSVCCMHPQALQNGRRRSDDTPVTPSKQLILIDFETSKQYSKMNASIAFDASVDVC